MSAGLVLSRRFFTGASVLTLGGLALLSTPAAAAGPTAAVAGPTAAVTGYPAYAWGFGDNGQLGNGTGGSQALPGRIGTATNWAQISAGWSHTVAVKTNGTLWVWGNGLLGTGSATEEQSPVQIGTDTNWRSVAAGHDHTAAIKTDGTLWTWGGNTYGQLGDNTHTDRFRPVRVGTRADWASVSTGYWHTAAIKTNGTLWAWGHNASGTLGDGTRTDRSFPTRVGTRADWASVFAGGDHTLAIKTGHTLWAWGSNQNGQLGDGTFNTSRLAPARVGTYADWSTAAAGSQHSLAIKTNGNLYAWGYDGLGQLGDIPPGGIAPGTANQLRPARVGGIGWATVASGYGHTLAIKTDRTLWAWGFNEDGQLGNGASLDEPGPVPSPVGVGIHWAAVATGFNHTVALGSS